MKRKIELKHGLISADDHVLEHPEVWTSRMSKQKWADRIPHIERQPDGRDLWLIDRRPVEFPAPAIAPLSGGERQRGPNVWEEVPAMAHDPHDRLKAMDANQIDCSVLYPTVPGLAAEAFGRIDNADLELACVQAYNDWLIEEWASVSQRFVPQCIVPIWPIERTVGEIKRAVAKGHKGVIYPASPMELRDVPHINEPSYDPLWTICQDLNVPICFHAGASPRTQLNPSEGFSPATALAFTNITRSVSSIAVVANVLFSKILHRFPTLKVIFSDCSLGWGAYELEYADYQSDADGLQSEGYVLKPSELFKRQCYFTCSYDRTSIRVRRFLGSSRVLWSTHLPLRATGPNSRQQIELSFSAVDSNEKSMMLWRNAAELYSL